MEKITIKVIDKVVGSPTFGQPIDPIVGIELSPDNYDYTENEMGENRVEFKIMIPQLTDNDGFPIAVPFNTEWFVDVLVNSDDANPIYERYFLKKHIPDGNKTTKSLQYEYSLGFEFIDRDLRRFRFRDYILGTTELDYNTKVQFVGDVKDFVIRLYWNMFHHFRDEWEIEFHQDGNIFYGKDGMQHTLGSIKSSNNVYEWQLVEFKDATLWDVLLKTFEIFELRWKLKYDLAIGKKKIIFNEPIVEVDHVFEYGGGLSRNERGGLVSIDRNNKEGDIITRLIGVGSQRNLPTNYFKMIDDRFLQDGIRVNRPTYFENLMPKAYRMYTMGFNDGNQVSGAIKNPLRPNSYPFVEEFGTIFNLPNLNNIQVNDFKNWRVAYINLDRIGSPLYSPLELLGFDDECFDSDGYVIPEMIDTDWDNIATRPFSFKAWVRGYRDAQRTPQYYSPLDYVESTMKEIYGIREGVLEENDKIYPSISNRWRPMNGQITDTMGTPGVTVGQYRTVYSRIDELVDCDILIQCDIKAEWRREPAIERGNGGSHTERIVRDFSSTLPFTVERVLDITTSVNGKPINKDLCVLDFTLQGVPSGFGIIDCVVEINDNGTWKYDTTMGGRTYNLTKDIDEEEPLAVWGASISLTSVGWMTEGSTTVQSQSFRHYFSTNGATYRIRLRYRILYGIRGSHSPTVPNNPTDPDTGEELSRFNEDSGIYLAEGGGSLTEAGIIAFISPIPIKTNFNVWTKDLGFDLSEERYWSTEELAFQFTTGLIAGDEYEFPVIKSSNRGVLVSRDTSKETIVLCYLDKERTQPVMAKVMSGYQIGLMQSDAENRLPQPNNLTPNEFKYPLPCSKIQIGDRKIYPNRPNYPNDLFILLNLELPFEYVYMAEDELEMANRIELKNRDRDKPQFSVDFDQIFTEEVIKRLDAQGKSHYDNIRAGNMIKVRNRSLINYIDEYGTLVHEHTLHIKTLTKTYKGESTAS